MPDVELIRSLGSIAHALYKALEDGALAATTRADLAAAAQLAEWLARRAGMQLPKASSHLAQRARLNDRALSIVGTAPDTPRLGGPRDNGPMLVGQAPPSGGIAHSSPMHQLARAASSGDQDLQAEAREILEQFVAEEDSYIGLVDAAASGGILSSFSRSSGESDASPLREEIIPTDKQLTAYLRHRFPKESAIRVTNVRQLPGGFGKTTIMFTVAGSDRIRGELVMRKDMPVMPVNTLAIDEFPLLSTGWERGIPVPEPLWAETDADVFGGTFIVVRKVEGSNDTSSWRDDRAACRRFGEQLAAAMAKIHAIRPADLGIDGVGTTASEAQQRHVYWVEDVYRAAAGEPNARIEAAFGWLLANTPPDEGVPPSLIHAGIGFHNMLTRPGRLTAILDWEVAHFGHPGDDLGYTKQFVSQLLPWEEYMEMYLAHGGVAFTAEHEHYYAVWRNLRNACFCAAVTETFLSGRFDSVRLAIAGLIHGPRFEIETLRQAIAR